MAEINDWEPIDDWQPVNKASASPPKAAPDVKAFFADPKNRSNPLQDAAKLLYGAETSIAGLPGTMESMARAGAHKVGDVLTNWANDNPDDIRAKAIKAAAPAFNFSETTAAPTPEDVQSFAAQHLAFPAVPKGGDPLVTAGEFLPAVGPTAALIGKAPKLARALASTPIAKTTYETAAGMTSAGRAALGKIADATTYIPRKIVQAIPESKTTKAINIANILKGDVTQTLGKTASADITAAQEAHDTAAAALADAQRVPTPTSIGIGEPREMTELGTPAKTGGVDAKQAMVDARHQMDSVLRPKQAGIVADNEENGIKFVDTPAIQELIAKIEPIVKPNVTTASATTNVTDPLTKSLYRRVYNSLISKEVELTAEEAVSAKANKLPVQEITDPVTGKITYKRTFDSSFQAAENLRRYLGDAFNKDTGAYGAINSNIKKDMYALLDKAQTEYIGAAHTDVQRSYAAFTKDLKPYEETTIGKQLTGTQGSTDIPSYTPADISKILLTGDRSKIDQIFKLAASKDRPAIKQSIADAIETAVNGKNRAAVAEMTKTGSPLSDILEHPELKEFRAPINNYVTRLGDAEQAAVTTKNLDLGTFKKGVSEAEKAGRATDVTINAINNAPVKDLPDLLSTHINKLYTDGKLSPEQFKSASEEIKSISKTFDKSKARSEAIAAFKKYALTAAAGASGAGAIYTGYKYVLGD